MSNCADELKRQIKGLTPREEEVMSLMSRGLTNFAIAEALYISIKTVERHIMNIYDKLELVIEGRHPRVSAARLYLEATGELHPQG